jgi:hypothetical protein
LAAVPVFLIRSDVKVAMPHFLGGKEEIKATFLIIPLAIRSILFEIAEMQVI